MYITLDATDSKSVLENNYLGHLSYIYQNRPYVVPITYFYDKDRNVIICYSGEGHKMHAMRQNKQVAMNAIDVDALTKWRSVMVHGTFEQLFASEAKSYLHDFSLGVKSLIVEKELKELSFISEFSSKAVNENLPMIFIIKIDEITGKMRKD
ncbi:pyridoxamine 5'-phosphate oxidase family protein [Gelidibacter salicanalis]|uniref:Pyridoxamine 5'-phosphate oxidase family protein n=1 Tax=Gelidibacter salicanalis TaxID=291193 RepID=A0A934KLL3_9FLAO|nr:pyridoxamine 5'-phosphate oxidase family protein [Gelidibacter salicanalis]MBJ7881422.1 pyridoxamine 5'-phosphate oxidase family protein [Gelidibacter salicanalis]